MVSKERLSRDLAEMAKCSDTQGTAGITRLAFTDSDWQGRAYIIGQMKELGLTVRIDAFGNVIGRWAGSREDLPAVLFGSHGDSVPHGGNYDGVVGVLAALEVIRSLKEEGFAPEHSLEVVLFMCEESSRFGAATLGSRAMLGRLSQADLQRLQDAQGKTLYAVLQERGLQPENVGTVTYPVPPKAFFEVHIEQGKVLEHQGISLGVVTGIAAPTRLRLHLHGKADHSGATPMGLRQDGLCAAAEVVLKLEELAAAMQEIPVVGTVGILKVQPCVMNVIPGECELGIDIRSISAAAKDKVETALRQAIAEICQRRHIPYDIEVVSKETPVAMRPEMVAFLQDICRKSGAECITMPSGAGHDAMHWAESTPTGMLFIPCKDGISHNAAEFADIEDIVNVTKVLAAAVKEAAQGGQKF